MPRPIHALIHPDALAHNIARAREAAPDSRVWAVVKANAYGHGIERAFDGLRGADGFALLDFDEAARLRALDWRGPILLLEGCFEQRDLELCSRLNLWHTVHCDEQIDWLAQHKTHTPHRVFLKLNSGMNRLGFSPAAFRGAWARLDALPQVDEISLMTHFSDADAPGGVEQQLAVFEEVTRDLAGERTLSNSAATLRHGRDPLARVPRIHNDWVRAGIMTYGSAPDFPEHSIADWRLRPTMTLKSRLIAVQALKAGDRVGYGSTYTAPTAQRIGVVACGYADGYPRSAAAGTSVLVDGVRTQLVGRVSMDMITVDLTPVPSAAIGSEVTLWGVGPAPAGGGAPSVLPIDEIARPAGTIGYEVMCALAMRVPVSVAPSGLDGAV